MKSSIIKTMFIVLLFFGILIIKNESHATSLPVVNIQGDLSRLTRDKNEEQFTITYTDTNLNFTKYATMKLQGSTSLDYEKNNFTIKFYTDSSYSKKEKIDMGKGWGKSNKYCLKANVIDKTHARNIVTSRLAAKVQEKYGIFSDTPNNGVIDGFPVQVNVNGVFYGLYTWNIPKDAWVWNIDKSNINNIVLQADYCNDYTYFKKEIESSKTLEESKWEIEEGSDTEENIKAKLNRLIKFVSESTDEEFKANFDKYLNKDAMLNYLSIMYASEGYDNVAKNLILVTYDGNIWYPILYDLDTTWGTRHRGNLGSNKDGKCEDYYWLPEGDSGYKSYAGDANDSVLLKKVIRCFPDELANRWFELRKNELSYDNIKNEFESFCNEIPQQMYAKDQEKWSTIAQYGKWDKTQIYGSDDSFLEIRLPYVDNVMYEKYTIKAKINVEYSTTDKTNKNVVATAIANRNDISFINGINTYTFSNNGVYKFEAVDYKGNKITKNAIVTWMDVDAPTLTITYSETSNISKTAIITSNEEVQEVEGWTLSEDKKRLTKIYIENTTENVIVKDLLGNESTISIEVSGIELIASDVFEIKENKINNIQPNMLYTDFIKNIESNTEYTIKEGDKEIATTDKIKTGQVLTVGKNTYTIVVLGDTNGDGKASVQDIMRINKHRLNKTQLTDCYLKAGDVNNDGKVNIQDIMKINKYRLGKISEL